MPGDDCADGQNDAVMRVDRLDERTANQLPDAADGRRVGQRDAQGTTAATTSSTRSSEVWPRTGVVIAKRQAHTATARDWNDMQHPGAGAHILPQRAALRVPDATRS